MEILFEPTLAQAQRPRLALHLRYSRRPHAAGASGSPDSAAAPSQAGGAPAPMSYVVIHRPYQYLEPVVRQLFQHAPDVQVIVDRRWRARRSTQGPPPGSQERRQQKDRRVAAPMLDILINVGT